MSICIKCGTYLSEDEHLCDEVPKNAFKLLIANNALSNSGTDEFQDGALAGNLQDVA